MGGGLVMETAQVPLLLVCVSLSLLTRCTADADVNFTTCDETKVDNVCVMTCTVKNVKDGVRINKNNKTLGQCLSTSSQCASSSHRYNVTFTSDPKQSTMHLHIRQMMTEDAGQWSCQSGDVKSQLVDVTVYDYRKIQLNPGSPRDIPIFCFHPKPSFVVENSTCELKFSIRQQKMSNCTDVMSKSYLVNVEQTGSCRPGVVSVAAYAGLRKVQSFDYPVKHPTSDQGNPEGDDMPQTALVVTMVLLLLLFTGVMIYLLCCYFKGKRYVRCRGRDKQTPEEVHEEVEKKIMLHEIERIEHRHFKDHHDNADDNHEHLNDHHDNVDKANENLTRRHDKSDETT